jgi:CRISPR system Cascade subunit CasB
MTSETQKFDPPFIALQWWKALTGKREGKAQSGADRAALARLRRASPNEAICEEATQRLFRSLAYNNPDRLQRVATLAAVLATIREDGPGRFGRQIGREKIDYDQTAKLKIGRFKRLLDAQTEDEIATAFRRAIAILGGAANVREVAKYVLFFDDERDDGRTRRRLVFDYYGAGEREAEPPGTKPAPTASVA